MSRSDGQGEGGEAGAPEESRKKDGGSGDEQGDCGVRLWMMERRLWELEDESLAGPGREAGSKTGALGLSAETLGVILFE